MTIGPSEPPRTFDEFWIWYLHQHQHPFSRALHYTGSISTIVLLLIAAFWSAWVLVLLPVVGYGPSWVGHFLIEKNKPATFGRPLWAAIAEYRMFWLWLTGRIGRRLDEAGIPTARRPAA